MNKTIFLICSSTILTGCAGINSDFEFNKPAKDSGYWLQQADEMTSTGSERRSEIVMPVRSHVDIGLYKLLDTGNIRLPVKIVTSSTLSTTITAGTADKSNEMAKVPFGDGDMLSFTNLCNSKYCYPEPNSPFRKNESISRLWIAPHVSPDNNAHLGEVIYFIAKKSSWLGMDK